MQRLLCMAGLMAMGPSFHCALAQTPEAAAGGVLSVVTITAASPTSLPVEIPTTMASASGEDVARTVNATDGEDALKYFASLLVRKRYIGDYNHAVLSSRASGTGNSARSAVYADGILLSNFLGNGATFAPRWALVTPEEIQRVEVMYGPFSAAYPGNSVGAVVDYVTRMPTQLEAHAKAGIVVQPFELYDTDDNFIAHQQSASLGDRTGNWSWWVNFNHTDSHSQPLTFSTRFVSAGVAGSAGVPVTGAIPGLDRRNNPWYLLGTATEYRTRQDHAKLKLSYELSSEVSASYVLGLWSNDSEGQPDSWLRDAAGNTVYGGTINVDGRAFALTATDFNVTDERLLHMMQGLSIKSHSGGRWDWELAASSYDYHRDELRTPIVFLPGASQGGAGTITDQDGTGWSNLALKGVWRPGEAHVFEFGVQHDRYRLRMLKSNVAVDWRSDAAGSFNSEVQGRTRLQSLYAQDSWAFAKRWKSVLGLRAERWTATEGLTATASSSARHARRAEEYLSPKAAVAWQWTDDRVLRLSLGRAIRTPTVNELYGATSGVLTVVNDPNLRPEKSWTSELTVQRDYGRALLRATLFFEAVKGSLYSERSAVGSSVVTRIVNVGKIATPGAEFVLETDDLLLRGLSLAASLTYADSRIRRNDGYVTVPGDTIGKRQPRVPTWRASALASFRFNEQWNLAVGLRYSGNQYSTLDNSDSNGFAYQGASRFITADARLRYHMAPRWTAALGVDNLNNYHYWNFHPYPQRSYSAELQYDL